MLEKIGVPDMVGMLVREAKIGDVADLEPLLFELIGERRWRVHRPPVWVCAALRPGGLLADAGVPEEVLLFVLDQVARDDQLGGNALGGIVVGERIRVGNSIRPQSSVESLTSGLAAFAGPARHTAKKSAEKK
jgi:hypothetical protein